MPIVPDTKDWTWVLQRPCLECGFDASTLPTDQIPPLIRGNAHAWLRILAEPASRLRARLRDDRWSPLEYACHVRDVFQLYDTRLDLMLTLDNPTFANWDQDVTAVDDAYNDQDPDAVAMAMSTNADAVAASFEAVKGLAWERVGSRSDGAHFTVDTFGRYLIHDPIHHLFDVTEDLSASQA